MFKGTIDVMKGTNMLEGLSTKIIGEVALVTKNIHTHLREPTKKVLKHINLGHWLIWIFNSPM
jgi:hypothetical protein